MTSYIVGKLLVLADLLCMQPLQRRGCTFDIVLGMVEPAQP
jgi:hypothetical protein